MITVDALTAAFLLPAAVRLLARYRLDADTHTQKPQDSFRHVLTDNTDAPFQHLAAPDGDGLQDGPQQRHPCEVQIRQLLQHTHVDSLSRFDSTPPSLHHTSCQWVATPAVLQSAVNALRSASCVAMDIEHNASRSYLGLTCLVQLSDGQLDYVIDALAVHDHMHLLQPLLSDPHVLKVLHGAGNDVLWLQRDFHIYVVNLIDTAVCCQVLGYQNKSLQHLLQTICGVATDKSYQQADWTERPLSEGALEYARTDVHYLLHIAAVLVRQLEMADALQQACSKSQSITLSLYAKPDPRAAISVAAAAVLRRVAAATADGQQADARVGSALRDCVYALCEWRDAVARQRDEGVQYILPSAALWRLAQRRPQEPAEALQIISSAQTDGPAAAQLTPADAQQICDVLAEAAAGRRTWATATADQLPAAPQQRVGNPKHTMSQEERRAVLRAKLIKKFSAQAPVYDNCRMLSREGDLLCFCDKDKANWYLDRGLAERVDKGHGPLTVRLLFQHQNSDQNAGYQDFYVTSRENRCVSCGDASHYLRYKVTPACYRRAFPVHLKSHRSHDIVLLCIDCHERAHTAAEVLKRDICREYGVPLMPDTAPAPPLPGGCEARPAPINVRRAAVALMHHRDQMPAERRRNLESVLKAYMGRQLDAEITETDVEEAMVVGLPRKSKQKARRRAGCGKAATAAASTCGSADGDVAVNGHSEAATVNGSAAAADAEVDKFGSNGHAWHGQRVVDKALARGGEAELQALARRFRESFVEALRPRFLPAAWQTDHDAKRDFGAYSIYRSSGQPDDTMRDEDGLPS